MPCPSAWSQGEGQGHTAWIQRRWAIKAFVILWHSWSIHEAQVFYLCKYADGHWSIVARKQSVAL
jgi:hypothetical protein